MSVLAWHRALLAYPDIEVVGFRQAVARTDATAIWLRRDRVEILALVYAGHQYVRAAAACDGVPVRSYNVGALGDPSIVNTFVRLVRQPYTLPSLYQRRRVAWFARQGHDVSRNTLADTARTYLLARRAVEVSGAWPTGQDIANVLDPPPAP